MVRLKLTLAYQGTRYSGWQMQARSCGVCPPTIQGELERSLAAIANERLVVHGAGRTDAGVHAEGQVCHVDVPERLARVDWQRAINSKLPPDIRVLAAERASAAFHARKSALAKRYAYSVWMGREKAVPRIGAFVWSLPPLDGEKVAAAITALTGRHDFASFQNAGTPLANTTRRLFSVDCLPGRVAALVCPGEWPVATYVFKGDGFLKQMIRNLMGLLAWVGQGRLAPEDIPAILAARDRRALPSPSAPPAGLTLLEVLYPPPDDTI